MGKRWWNNTWLKQLTIAVGYAALYEAAHPFSHVQFALAAALRLVCLMCVPYRYWPALLAGDFLPNFLAVYPCLDQFGPAWVAWRAVPPIAIVMPIVWFCRERLTLFPNQHLVDVRTLLSCVLAAALANTGYSVLAVALANDPSGALTPTLAFAYFIGFYFAMLALVPWVLIARFEYRPDQWREKIRLALESRLLLEGMTVMLPATILLAVVSHRPGADHPQLVLMAMFLPVAWLTLRHGWRAAAFGSAITIICAVLVLPSEAYGANVSVMHTELFLALTLTSLFALGARISSQLLQESQRLHQTLDVRQQARQSYLQGEQKMRQTAQALEYVAGTLQVTNGRLLQHIRRVFPHIENESYYKQALTAQDQVYRLAERLHPIAWRERGLPAALQETVGGALEEAGIAYRCEVAGRGFTRMQSAVLIAAYRAACEAVVYVTARLACSSIRLTLRGGETNGARWIFVGIEGSMDDTKVAQAIHNASDRRRLAAKLGAMGLDIGELRDHVRLFDGELHQRNGHDRLLVTMLLHGSAEERQRHESASVKVQLWVR